MSQLIKKQNMTITTGTYTDKNGQEKKSRKTFATLITMQGDDGSIFQFGEMWGPHGVTMYEVWDEKEDNQAAPPPQQGGYNQQAPHQQQAPQNYQQPPQGGYRR